MFARGSNQSGLQFGFQRLREPRHRQGNGDGPTNYYNRNMTVNGIYTLSPTTILNFNYGFARDISVRTTVLRGNLPSDYRPPRVVSTRSSTTANFRRSASAGTMRVTISGQSSYTTLYDFPYSHILRGDVTKILGKHTLKMGGVWEKLFVNFTQLGSPDGQFSFGSRLHAAERLGGYLDHPGKRLRHLPARTSQQQRRRFAVQLTRPRRRALTPALIFRMTGR